MFQNINYDVDIDKVLGTPSAQKILRFMTIWETLSFQKLVEFTELSSSQVQSTLNNLINLGLVNRVSKGFYELSASTFSSKLKETYDSFHLHFLNHKLSIIEQLIKANKIKESFPLFKVISVRYKPFLDNHFSHKMSNIGQSVLNRLQM